MLWAALWLCTKREGENGWHAARGVDERVSTASVAVVGDGVAWLRVFIELSMKVTSDICEQAIFPSWAILLRASRRGPCDAMSLGGEKLRPFFSLLNFGTGTG